jgi:hypothetical protein
MPGEHAYQYIEPYMMPLEETVDFNRPAGQCGTPVQQTMQRVQIAMAKVTVSRGNRPSQMDWGPSLPAK